MTRDHRPPPVFPGMVRIRLRGLPGDTDTAARLLGEFFDIAADGGNKTLKREQTPEVFRYLHVRPITDPACALCGCTDANPCQSDIPDDDETCYTVETSLVLRVCSVCVRTLARDAIDAGEVDDYEDDPEDRRADA